VIHLDQKRAAHNRRIGKRLLDVAGVGMGHKRIGMHKGEYVTG
jgi:hypothetical protein